MSGLVVLVLRLLLAVALYAFLGWALIFLWREVNRQGAILSKRRTPNISLNIISGNKKEIQRHFSQTEIILGRDPGCDVPLTEDETISTRHAQLSYHHGQWWILDLASTNGTFLNQVMVTMPTVITTGDEIKCGNANLSVNIITDALDTPTQKADKRNG
ncbi:MAG: FHA domain-containing protein [Anaerolineales bacterium]